MKCVPGMFFFFKASCRGAFRPATQPQKPRVHGYIYLACGFVTDQKVLSIQSGRNSGPRASLKGELFCVFKHQLEMSARSKWWPLPSHTPLPIRKSKFSFPQVATVKLLYSNMGAEPALETVWLRSWH